MTQLVFLAVAIVPAAYQFAAIAACLKRMRFRQPATTYAPPVSILKPVRGADPDFYEAIRSQASIEYPDFEILFGVSDPNDSALPEIERLQKDHPNRAIRIVKVTTETPNGKVGSLIDLEREARFDLLVLSDSDIRVPADYLTKVVAPLADPRIGLVTCLYRAHGGGTFGGLLEAIGIETDFAPSALVAPLTGVDEFAFGSTIAVRRGDLQRIGGFQAVADYLADDYQIGKRIHALGLKCVLAETIVDTHMRVTGIGEAWTHQLRWARTIRVSRPGGYAGLFVTFATAWGLVLIVGFGQMRIGCTLLLIRMLAAAIAGIGVMKSAQAGRFLWLVPLRDLCGAAVWAAGLFGKTVQWRGQRLALGSDGRILVDQPVLRSR